MSINDFKKTKLWHKEFKNLGYDSKLIFKKAKTKFEILSSLSFFLTIMASEILLNQPIKKKINMYYNEQLSQDILISNGEIFNIPFNITWKQDQNKLEKCISNVCIYIYIYICIYMYIYKYK